MAWIESHQELNGHPKTAVLSELMGWSKFETIGRLHCFWYWCLSYAPTGEIGRFNDALIASSVELNREEGKKFKEAMITAGWLDRIDSVLRIHDWPQYAGRYLRDSKFKRSPEMWEKLLKLYDLSADNPPTFGCTRGLGKVRSGTVGLVYNPKEVFQNLSMPDKFLNAEFQSAMLGWVDRRMGGKKPGCDWHDLFQEQVNWLATFDLNTALQVIAKSMRNGWTGLCDPNENKMHRPGKATKGVQEEIIPKLL